KYAESVSWKLDLCTPWKQMTARRAAETDRLSSRSGSSEVAGVAGCDGLGFSLQA
ncbi:hypothetical protein A2U01_0087055, partial [Trifolium medium]|nr:hypothetical protein [Trifolium medium]